MTALTAELLDGNVKAAPFHQRRCIERQVIRAASIVMKAILKRMQPGAATHFPGAPLLPSWFLCGALVFVAGFVTPCRNVAGSAAIPCGKCEWAKSLSGEWEVQIYPILVGGRGRRIVHRPEFDASAWSEIRVPGHAGSCRDSREPQYNKSGRKAPGFTAGLFGSRKIGMDAAYFCSSRASSMILMCGSTASASVHWASSTIPPHVRHHRCAQAGSGQCAGGAGPHPRHRI